AKISPHEHFQHKGAMKSVQRHVCALLFAVACTRGAIGADPSTKHEPSQCHDAVVSSAIAANHSHDGSLCARALEQLHSGQRAFAAGRMHEAALAWQEAIQMYQQAG